MKVQIYSLWLMGSARLVLFLGKVLPVYANDSALSPQSSLSMQKTDKLNPDLAINPLEQVTSVSELRDVQPTDWAYEMLKSLVERYGYIVGYPGCCCRC